MKNILAGGLQLNTGFLRKVLDHVPRWALYLMAALVPLFFLPGTTSVIGFGKQQLLLLLSGVGLLAWASQILTVGKVPLRVSWPHVAAALFVIAVLVVGIFSMYPYGSLWGYPLETNQAFFTVLALAVMVLLFASCVRNKTDVMRLVTVLTASSLIAIVIGILQFYGRFLLGFPFTQSTSFNTLGTANQLGVFAAALVPLLLSVVALQKRFAKWMSVVAVVVLIFTLFVVNYQTSWIVLAVGIAVLLVFSMYDRGREKAVAGFVPVLLLAVSLFFILFQPSLGFLPSAGVEVLPSVTHTMAIAQQTFFESPVVGSGSGTFIYDYAQHRSGELNGTIFWATRFSSGYSEMLEQLATRGALGMVTFLLFIGTVLVWGLRGLTRQPQAHAEDAAGNESWLITLGMVAGFVALVVSLFIYPSGVTTDFLLWFFAAGILYFTVKRSITIDLHRMKAPFRAAISFATIFVLVAVLAIFLFSWNRVAAERAYASGLQQLAQDNTPQSLVHISEATHANPDADVYWRDLSRVATTQLSSRVAADDADVRQVQLLFQLMIDAALRSTNVSPHNVANWIALGDAYRNAIGLTREALNFATRSYDRAAELAPNNPGIPLAAARAYMAESALQTRAGATEEANQHLATALELLDEAIRLKPNYWAAHFQRGIVLDGQGRLSEAIRALETIRPFNVQDASLAFQLGSYYWREDRFTEAQVEFERAVQIAPRFSNARFFLGLLYDRQGDTDGAIEEFEAIAALSEANNKQVADILRNLRAGLPALETQDAAVDEIPALEGGEEERVEEIIESGK